MKVLVGFQNLSCKGVWIVSDFNVKMAALVNKGEEMWLCMLWQAPTEVSAILDEQLLFDNRLSEYCRRLNI